MGRRSAALVLLAPSGPVRDGLAALFGATPGMSVTVLGDDWDSALEGVRRAPPDLIVLDGALAQRGLGPALAQLRAAAPASTRLVLVDDAAQLAPTRTGEIVMLKGAPAAKLVEAVQALYNQ